MPGRIRIADIPGGAVHAAEYIRMSTEHQQYSIENQHDAIQRYADSKGMLLVQSFIDAGKSGVGIQGRDALPRSTPRRMANDYGTRLEKSAAGGSHKGEWLLSKDAHEGTRWRHPTTPEESRKAGHNIEGIGLDWLTGIHRKRSIHARIAAPHL